jgi:uncharacterized phage infection (PIP) family protein YhgE
MEILIIGSALALWFCVCISVSDWNKLLIIIGALVLWFAIVAIIRGMV